MEETQERSLQREAVKMEIAETPTPFRELDPEVQLAIKCAADKKAFDIVRTETQYRIDKILRSLSPINAADEDDARLSVLLGLRCEVRRKLRKSIANTRDVAGRQPDEE